MKMFRYLFILILLGGIIPKLKGQEVVYSAYDKFDYRNSDYAVVGMVGGILYNYRNSPEGAILEGFDDSMNKVSTVILDFFPRKIYSARFIAYTDRIIALYQALESNKRVQYAALLDEKGRLMGRPFELGAVKTGLFGPVKSVFVTTVSEDKRTILVYTIDEKNGGIEFDGRWLNDSAQLVKRGRATFKAENSVSAGDVNIDNSGNVYLEAYTTVGYQDYADQFWVLALPSGGSKFTATELDLNGKFVTGGYLRIDNLNNRVYFGGFYSERKNGGYRGIVFASYRPESSNYEQQKMLPFDEELGNVSSEVRKNHAFDNFMVKQLIVKNDGGFVMISESIFITSRNTYMPGVGYYSSFYSPFGPYANNMVREYHYNDVLAISYDKNGSKLWSTFIPKAQYSQEDGGMFSSYALLNSGGTLAFLFNDFDDARSKIQLATLDANGKTVINSFTAEGNDNPDWLPRAGKQVAARVLIVPCLHKRQICYAKVVF